MPRRNGGIESSSFQESKAKIAEDLRLLAQDAEEFAEATRGELSSAAKEIQERMKGLLHDAQETCQRLEAQAEAGIKATDLVIRNNPYRAIGIAMGVGFLTAYLVKRKL